MNATAIQCRNLSLHLGGVEILRDISLSLEKGQVHAIVGPNGGGKTSLLRCLLGQMPHRGSLESLYVADSIVGYVPQQLDFDKTLPISVYDFMFMICEAYRPAFVSMRETTRIQIEAALERVGLKGKRDVKLGSLSGGERQRVLFAQALIPDPDLLVLDEPMTSMDQPGESIFLDLIADSAARGTTVLWIAHDLKQVKSAADTVTGICCSLRFHGAPENVLASTNLFELFREDSVQNAEQSDLK